MGTMSEDTRFDGMFLTVAQQAQGIEPLLDNLFGFLRRKTDFFAGASKEKIESLVLKVLNDQSVIHERDTKKKELERQMQQRKKDELKKKIEKKAFLKIMIMIMLSNYLMMVHLIYQQHH